MATKDSVKIKNFNRVYRIPRPQKLQDLIQAFQTRFSFGSTNLSIYYLDTADNEKTHIMDEDDFQLSVCDGENVTYFCDDPSPGAAGSEPLTFEVVRNNYFKNWHMPTNSFAEFANKKYACYVCVLSRRPTPRCSECGGDKTVDFDSPLIKLNQMIVDAIRDIVLAEFKRLNDEITSKNNKLDMTQVNLSLSMNRSALELNKTYLMNNTSLLGKASRNDSFSQKLKSTKYQLKDDSTVVTKQSIFEANEDHQLISTQIGTYSPISAQRQDANRVSSSNVSFFNNLLEQPCPKNNKQDSLNALLSTNIKGADEAKPARTELHYKSVTLAEGCNDDKFITLKLLIKFEGSQVKWPEGVYLVGAAASELTRDVMVKIKSPQTPNAILPEIVKFQFNKKTCVFDQPTEMEFTFQKDDRENNIRYWSNPFMVKYQLSKNKSAGGRFSCNFLSC